MVARAGCGYCLPVVFSVPAVEGRPARPLRQAGCWFGHSLSERVDAMMIAVVGGALQGVEVAYLLRKAGLEVLLVDRRPGVPAAGLCPAFRQVDVTDPLALDRGLAGADIIFPALESRDALGRLVEWARARGIPILHDPPAYAVSASKIASETFFRRAGIPIPRSWPGCPLPVIAKPAYGSGSQGIRLFWTDAALRQALGDDPAAKGWQVQEFLSGPTYSVEVVRARQRTTAVQVTDLHMDARYDCKRVTAPSALTEGLQAELLDLARQAAEALPLTGIMDVEAVLHDGAFKVLEIDARFPSQTPITVYHSCGVNLAAALVRTAGGADGAAALQPRLPARGALLEHVRVAPGSLEVTGEHALAEAGPLKVVGDFFGADEAITDFAEGRARWVATLIFTGEDARGAWDRRQATIAALRRRFRLERYADPAPPEPREDGLP